MIYAKQNTDGKLTDFSNREPQTYDDGSIDVPVIAMPSGNGPWGYDADNQVAVPYVPPLAQYKTDKINALNNEAIGLVESRYPATVQAGFAGLMAAANAGGRPNQAAYCAQLLTWGASVVAAYATAAAQVNVAADYAGVDAVSLDIATLAASDPAVNLPGALAITN